MLNQEVGERGKPQEDSGQSKNLNLTVNVNKCFPIILKRQYCRRAPQGGVCENKIVIEFVKTISFVIH